MTRHEQILLEKGFYFLLVTNGTVRLSGSRKNHVVNSNELLIVTPSVKASLSGKSTELAVIGLYINPDYFDTLSVGQLVYNQVSQFISNHQMPIYSLRPEQADYLKKTLVLFTDQLKYIHLYREGAIRHLCSFLLLQMADMLHQDKHNVTVNAKRSNEIFWHFKKLLLRHYREQHSIRFYANQLNISTTYLSRIIKQTTGHTVCFHISELLYADARKLLECTCMNVQEIADTLGFSDQSVFGKFFRRKTGISPVRFRNRKEQ